MRIVQLIDSFDYGGAEQMVANLSICLSERGHSVHAICLRDIGGDPRAEPRLKAAGVRLLTLNKPGGFSMPTVRRLAQYLREEQIEVVHTHNHLVHHYGVAAARLAGARIALNTLHGTATLRMQTWAKGLFWTSCMLSRAVVSVCGSVRESFGRQYLLPRAMLATVDNGIDLSRFLEIPLRRRDRTPVIGTIARLIPVKGLATLLQAFAQLRRESPQLKLRLAGDGPLAGELGALTRNLGLENAVELCGFVGDTPGFLASLDLYVISSTSEGLPISLIEAMASGLPVVSTTVGGIPEIVTRSGCGWLCPPSSPDKLAAALREAIAAPDLAERSIQARQHALDRYSVARMTSEYEQLYERLSGA